ncbi:MAG TPA: L-ribulose-5-phosphate 4-epimerase AraD [Phycisphaerae bacterium]|nr:L-ribulose-5-phosphate 4-epimerase AraD [Phycisphaerae bacterium]
MLDDLRQQVCQANRRLIAEHLAFGTFGNASGVDRAGGHAVIKPSGVPHEQLAPERMVVVSLADGRVVEGDLRPSSDTPTHLELYRAFEAVGGIVHTHSVHATAWAQAQRDIPALGTTHADFFNGPIPCTRLLKSTEIAADYETNTGKVIVERFAELDPTQVPGVLVAHHGPFAWGPTVAEAVDAAVTLEHVARLASETLHVEPNPQTIHRELLEKHFSRKHGPGAYYGQR